jgi:hypothetical protein
MQAAYQAAVITSTGSQTVPIANVDARLGEFYLDLLDSTGVWQNGTVLVSMGRLVGFSGQSQAVRQIGKMPTYGGTMASLGVAISAHSTVFARYTDVSRSVTTPVWARPADSSNYDSTFTGEFLRRQEAVYGVNCSLVGHAVGDTQISQWQPGGTYFNQLAAVLDAVGGFEAFFWHQGGNDAGAGTTGAAYQAGLTGFFGGLAAHNVARGSSFQKIVCAMATRLAGGAGTAAEVTAIRKAAKAWSVANSATYIEPRDVVLEGSDAVHQGQVGSIRAALHVHRATQGVDTGPQLTSAVRATNSKDVVLTFSLPSGAASLVMTGVPSNRFAVCASGSTTPLALDGATPVAVGTTTITMKLSVLPANTDALDVYILPHPDPSGSTAASSMVYDDYNADSIGFGRHVVSTYDPTVAAAPGGTPTPTPTTALVDTFTGTSGTNLTAHAADTGQSWTAGVGTLLLGAANDVYATAASTYLSSYTPASADAFVTGVVKQITSGGSQGMGAVIRAVDANNLYQATYQNAGSKGAGWYFGKRVAGTYADFATNGYLAQTIADGFGAPFRIEAQGSTLRLITDAGTLTVTDTTFAAAGKVGIRASGLASSATTGMHFDDMTADVL